jgi:hypothetical protein
LILYAATDQEHQEILDKLSTDKRRIAMLFHIQVAELAAMKKDAVHETV